MTESRYSTIQQHLSSLFFRRKNFPFVFWGDLRRDNAYRGAKSRNSVSTISDAVVGTRYNSKYDACFRIRFHLIKRPAYRTMSRPGCVSCLLETRGRHFSTHWLISCSGLHANLVMCISTMENSGGTAGVTQTDSYY